jgi:hypothetical protein
MPRCRERGDCEWLSGSGDADDHQAVGPDDVDAPDGLGSLLDRLKQAQHALIDDAAQRPGLPSTAIIRKIAALENAITADLALIEERQDRR